MEPHDFDKLIKKTLGEYGPIGTRAQILSASQRWSEHGTFTTVTVEVTVSDKGHTKYAEEWHYGGVNTHEKIRIPVGIRPIDGGRLIGAERATQALPPGFPLDRADCRLFWALTPSMSEPTYNFTFEDITIALGAYTGDPHRG